MPAAVPSPIPVNAAALYSQLHPLIYICICSYVFIYFRPFLYVHATFRESGHLTWGTACVRRTGLMSTLVALLGRHSPTYPGLI